MTYADVILPFSLENSYTYSVPDDMKSVIKPGCRVIVHFGKKKYYTAIVMSVYENTPQTKYEIKEIYTILDSTPVLRRPQLKFWQWISSYYLCKLGDVYKAALPSGLKLESETIVYFNLDFEATAPLKPNEQSILNIFGTEEKLSVAEIEKKTGIRNALPAITSLIGKGAVEVGEELKRGYTPKTQIFVRLSAKYREDEQNLQEAFKELKNAKKQEALLIAYLDLSLFLNPALRKELSKKELLDHVGVSSVIFNGLVKRGLFETYEKEIGRLQIPVCRLQPLKKLSEEQFTAYNNVRECFEKQNVCLLHGVTSSGKTEIYMHLIDEVLKNGRQVLYLLPEIAITTHMTERLANHFGDKLLVYHSRFSDNERVEVWNKLLLEDGVKLVLGVRSSLFLPFKDLGLVIVDEEHENTYKQYDPAPRYNARNSAIVLAGMHGAKTLLASATPSIDSYFNAINERYGLVALSHRFGKAIPPEVIPVDIKEQKRKKLMKRYSLFSPLLIDKINTALGREEQVILFQNRRGFAPLVECKECGYVPHCVNCDVSLTLHKYQNRLVCHYCGYSVPLISICPACESTDINPIGFGTEKVEEEIKTLFPAAKVDRLDFDTTRTKRAYERIFDDFDKGKTQILIGTQMLSKGLDFGKVTVVGILNADTLMNFPDFRAHERAFQLMVQVCGRAGRRDAKGCVVLQTSQPEHPLIDMVKRSAYKEMVDLQLEERLLFRYPPYYRLINLVLKSRNEASLRGMAQVYADKLRANLGESRVLGPVTPAITKVQTFYVRNIVIKIEIAVSISAVREILENVYTEMQSYPVFRQLMAHYDVDPL